jgi:hypothetical protein
MSADADCNETDMTAWLGKEEIMIDDFEGPAAVQALRDQVLRDRLNALAQYAPIFTAPGFEFASWQKYPPDEQGRIVVPECVLGPEARAFVATAYEFRWVVRAFNWSAWRNSAEAQGLLANPAHIAAASAEQLSKLLTGFIRNDKFCEGALLRAFEAGFLTAIVERARALSNPESQDMNDFAIQT